MLWCCGSSCPRTCHKSIGRVTLAMRWTACSGNGHVACNGIPKLLNVAGCAHDVHSCFLCTTFLNSRFASGCFSLFGNWLTTQGVSSQVVLCFFSLYGLRGSAARRHSTCVTLFSQVRLARCAHLPRSESLRRLICIPPRSMTCGPRGPPSPCLLVTRKAVGGPPNAPAGSSCGNVLFRSTSSTTMSSRMVSACSARPGGDHEKPSTGRSHTWRSLTPTLLVPHQPLHSLKTSLSYQHGKTPQNPDPIVRRLVPRHVGPVEDTTAMGHAAVPG